MIARLRTLTSLDGGVLVATGILVGAGIVMLYSTTAALALGETIPPLFLRHLAAVAVATLLAAVAACVPTSWWRRLALPLWGLGVLLLLATLFFGVRVNGAQRWLAVPGLGLTFQPGELVKWATLLASAAVLADLGRLRRLTTRRLLLPAILVSVPAGLLVSQPDLGSAVLLVAMVALVAIVAGTPLRLFVVPGAVATLGVAVLIALKPYALRRITSFLRPWETANDEGFQLVQSFVAFGRGGLTGVGLGDGRQTLFYLPEAHTDFILSVVAEEAGLVGVLAILGAFAALLVAGLRIAGRARDRFALLAAFGMTSLLAIPALVNAAVVMGLLPTKGLTLPFLSYGRTSLLVSFLATGVLLGIGRREARPKPRPVTGAEPRRSWAR
jgi:cell division protein FtsW